MSKTLKVLVLSSLCVILVGCSTASNWNNAQNCKKLKSDDRYYSCYVIIDGKVETFKKPIIEDKQRRNETDELEQTP